MSGRFRKDELPIRFDFPGYRGAWSDDACLYVRHTCTTPAGALALHTPTPTDIHPSSGTHESPPASTTYQPHPRINSPSDRAPRRLADLMRPPQRCADP